MTRELYGIVAEMWKRRLGDTSVVQRTHEQMFMKLSLFRTRIIMHKLVLKPRDE
jgi:hypothetical protein